MIAFLLEVIGYPETKELINDGEEYNYVYLHIKETNSDLLIHYSFLIFNK